MAEVTHGCTSPGTRVSDYPWNDRAPSSDTSALPNPTTCSAEVDAPLLACTSTVKDTALRQHRAPRGPILSFDAGLGGARRLPRQGSRGQICTARGTGGGVVDLAPIVQTRHRSEQQEAGVKGTAFRARQG